MLREAALAVACCCYIYNCIFLFNFLSFWSSLVALGGDEYIPICEGAAIWSADAGQCARQQFVVIDTRGTSVLDCDQDVVVVSCLVVVDTHAGVRCVVVGGGSLTIDVVS
mgnify:CR=1 FL=1